MNIYGTEIEIKIDPLLIGTPARVHVLIPHKKGVVTLSKETLNLPKDTQRFILLHEVGHVALNSGDEEKVDRWAFKKYALEGRSMKAAVFALSEVLLPLDHQAHEQRVRKQFYRAKHENFMRGFSNWKEFRTQKI